MADKKIYVGRSVNSFNSSKAFAPISRVTFKKKDDFVVTAGDDTGFELVADCPWATQEMANAVLAEVGGYVYQPYEATRAVVPLDVELGLGVTINGVYSVIASLTENFNAMFSADVSAPDLGELEDEYPIEAAKDRQVNRRISEAEAAIKVNADNIALSVKDGTGNGTTFTVTANGASFVDENGETVEINGGTLKAGTVEADTVVAGIGITSPNITGGVVTGTEIYGGKYGNLDQNGDRGNAYMKLQNATSSRDDVILFLTTESIGDSNPIIAIGGFQAAIGKISVIYAGHEPIITTIKYRESNETSVSIAGDSLLIDGELSLSSHSYGSASDRDSISSPSEGQIFFVV